MDTLYCGFKYCTTKEATILTLVWISDTVLAPPVVKPYTLTNLINFCYKIVKLLVKFFSSFSRLLTAKTGKGHLFLRYFHWVQNKLKLINHHPGYTTYKTVYWKNIVWWNQGDGRDDGGELGRFWHAQRAGGFL